MQAHLSTIKKESQCRNNGHSLFLWLIFWLSANHSALTSAKVRVITLPVNTRHLRPLKIQIMVLAHRCNTLHLLTVYSLSPQTRKYSIFYYALLESILSSWLLSMCIVTALDMALYCCFTQSVI